MRLFFMTFYLSIFSVLNHLIQFSAQFIIFILAMSPLVSAWFVSIYIFNFALIEYILFLQLHQTILKWIAWLL